MNILSWASSSSMSVDRGPFMNSIAWIVKVFSKPLSCYYFDYVEAGAETRVKVEAL